MNVTVGNPGWVADALGLKATAEVKSEQEKIGLEIKKEIEVKEIEGKGFKAYSIKTSGEHNSDEDKVYVDTEGNVVLIDMMGGYAKDKRVVEREGKIEVMNDMDFASKVMKEDYRFNDKDQQERLKREFERHQGINSWVGDKLKDLLVDGLEKIAGDGVEVSDVKLKLSNVFEKVNNELRNVRRDLEEVGLRSREGLGGTAVFGKLVKGRGEGWHFVGLRIGDARVGVRKANGETEIFPNEGLSVENYACGEFPLELYLARRNITEGSLTGNERDIDNLKGIDITLEQGDQLLFMTDGITDSLEREDRRNPWGELIKVWHKNAGSPEKTLGELAKKSWELTDKLRAADSRTRGKGVIEGFFPKKYKDDQGGVLLEIRKELEMADKGKEMREIGFKTKVVRMIVNILETLKEGQKEEISLNEFVVEDFLNRMAEMTKEELMAGARELYPDKKPDIALAQMYADLMETVIDLKLDMNGRASSGKLQNESYTEAAIDCINRIKRGEVTQQVLEDLVYGLGGINEGYRLLMIRQAFAGNYPNQKGGVLQAQFYADLMATMLELRKKKP